MTQPISMEMRTVGSTAEVCVVVMARGVYVEREDCSACGASFLVARGPGFHYDQFPCGRCSTLVGATESESEGKDG